MSLGFLKREIYIEHYYFVLAAYISLDTVVLEDTGRVTFCPVPEDHELEVVYLAPELQQQGVVTEKVRAKLCNILLFFSVLLIIYSSIYRYTDTL